MSKANYASLERVKCFSHMIIIIYTEVVLPRFKQHHKFLSTFYSQFLIVISTSWLQKLNFFKEYFLFYFRTRGRESE